MSLILKNWFRFSHLRRFRQAPVGSYPLRNSATNCGQPNHFRWGLTPQNLEKVRRLSERSLVLCRCGYHQRWKSYFEAQQTKNQRKQSHKSQGIRSGNQECDFVIFACLYWTSCAVYDAWAGLTVTNHLDISVEPSFGKLLNFKTIRGAIFQSQLRDGLWILR